MENTEWSLGDLIDKRYFRNLSIVQRAAIDVRHLPVEKIVRNGPGSLGIWFLAFSLLFGLGPAIYAIISGGLNNLFGFISGTLIWAILLFLALWNFKLIVTTSITSEAVSYKKGTLFGETEWSEPLSEYEGVLLSEEKIGSKRHFSILLYHSQKKKRVELIRLGNYKDHRNVWHVFAEALGMPALEKTKEGIVESKGGSD